MKPKKEIEIPEQRTATVTELKAAAFDVLVEIERLKAIYNNIQNEIAKQQANNDTTVG